MSVIRITKECSFDTAHVLEGYPGKCKNIHGHTYHLKVTVKGKVNNADIPQKGMVMDFGDLKKILKEHIIPLYDHKLIINAATQKYKNLLDNEGVRPVNYQPTSENMLLEMVAIIKQHLPSHITLHKVFLRETATSFAEWHAEDN
ncbi:MAG: 6-carboxytetrahydropterin synthase [Vicingaceae bacterium]|jgi:6-pyruvoyltetrahydropterin/6-carboxytetrahydropterin synthase